MSSSAFDVFVLPTFAWLGGLLLAMGALKSLVLGVDRLAARGRGAVGTAPWRHRPI